MAAKLFSAFLVLLLLVGVLVGQCAACPLLAPEKTPDCCQHHQEPGNCQAPTPKDAGATCPHLALAPAADQPSPLSVTHFVALPAVLPVIAEPVPAEVCAPGPRSTVVHSPPDLYLLNAALLV